MLPTLINRPEIYGVDIKAGPGLWANLIEVDEHDFLPRVRKVRRTQDPPHAAAARGRDANPLPADEETDNPDPTGEAKPERILAEADADNSARQAWQRAQGALALQLTAREYDTLVGPCRFLSCEDGELKLLVPNSVARDLLGNRLRPWLKEHLAQRLGEYVDVHLILDTGAPSTPMPDLAQRLVAAGVFPRLAGQLVRDYGADVCLAELHRLDEVRRHTHIEQPGAWLVGAIRAAAPARDRQE